MLALRLSCTVMEIYKASKLLLAHVKGQKFTAHARRHVTCRWRVKNDYIFGIPDAILLVYYATFTGV